MEISGNKQVLLMRIFSRTCSVPTPRPAQASALFVSATVKNLGSVNAGTFFAAKSLGRSMRRHGVHTRLVGRLVCGRESLRILCSVRVSNVLGTQATKFGLLYTFPCLLDHHLQNIKQAY